MNFNEGVPKIFKIICNSFRCHFYFFSPLLCLLYLFIFQPLRDKHAVSADYNSDMEHRETEVKIKETELNQHLEIELKARKEAEKRKKLRKEQMVMILTLTHTHIHVHINGRPFCWYTIHVHVYMYVCVSSKSHEYGSVSGFVFQCPAIHCHWYADWLLFIVAMMFVALHYFFNYFVCLQCNVH